MVRPIKAILNDPPAEGADDFVVKASALLTETLISNDFYEDSIDYDDSVFQIDGFTNILPSDLDSIGVKEGNTYAPLRVDASTGTLTAIPSFPYNNPNDEGKIVKVKMLEREDVFTHKVVTSSDPFDQWVSPELAPRGAFGMTNGYRFFQLADFNFNRNPSDGVILTDYVGGKQNQLHAIIRIPEVSDVTTHINDKTFSAGGNDVAPPMPASAQVKLGDDLFLEIRHTDTHWEFYAKMVDLPEEQITLSRSITSGIIVIKMRSHLISGMNGSSLSVTLGAFGLDDYEEAFSVNYDSLDPENAHYLGGIDLLTPSIISDSTIFQTRNVEFVSTKNYKFQRANNALIFYVGASILPLRLFDVQFQDGSAYNVLAGV